jgi:hypothetical protein
MFASHISCAASIDSTDNITSLSPGGAYSTERDLERKNAAHLTAMGGRMEYLGMARFRIGLGALATKFDHAIRPERLFALEGSDSRLIGCDVAASIGPLWCGVEYATTPRGDGVRVQAQLGAGQHGSIALQIVSAAAGFHSLLAAGGGYGATMSNTHEVTFGIDASPLSGLDLRAEFSQYAKPWRTIGDVLPAVGRSLTLEAVVRLARRFDLSFRGETRGAEHGQVIDDEGRTGRPMLCENLQRLQCTAHYAGGSTWHVRGRYETLRFENPATGVAERGWLVFGELRFAFQKRVELSGRLTLFQTATYNARLYAYEPNLEGLSASTLFLGTGRRWVCNCSVRVFDSLVCSGRYASTEYLTGARIQGNDAQMALQFDFQVDPP